MRPITMGAGEIAEGGCWASMAELHGTIVLGLTGITYEGVPAAPSSEGNVTNR